MCVPMIPAPTPVPPIVQTSPGGSEKQQPTDNNYLLLPLALGAIALIVIIVLALFCFTRRRRRRRKLSDGITHHNPAFENNLYGDDPEGRPESELHRVDSSDMSPPPYPCPPPPYPGTATMERQSSDYLEPVTRQAASVNQPRGATAEPGYGGYETIDSTAGYAHLAPRTEKQQLVDGPTEYAPLTRSTEKRQLSTNNGSEKADEAIALQPEGAAATADDSVYETIDQRSDCVALTLPTEKRPVSVSQREMCADNDVNESIHEGMDKVAE